MPIEILETIANVNYNTPRPRPINPAVLFDMTKIRRLVDEATNLAVRAASDISSPIMTNVNGGMPGASSMSALGMGGPGHGSKLSRERKFRMREQASQKLSRAYRLDEIACSVATMQGSSPIEEVAGLVLQRSPQDPDAKYVHFFHEKIPSRQLAESTSLEALTEVISEKPSEGEALRTRAIVRTFKEDYEGAVQDLTLALSISRFHQPPHPKTGQQSQTQESQQGRRRPQDVVLADKDQPTSLEGQLLFLRATAYLTMACRHVADGIPPAQESNGHADADTSGGNPVPEANGRNSPDADAELEVDAGADSAAVSASVSASGRKQAESRKLVKTYAKRALRDFMSFLSQLEYAPRLPTVIAKDFNDRVNLAAHGVRNPRPSETTYPLEPYAIYSIADLFAAVPPPDLPPYPSEDTTTKPGQASAMPQTCEWTSYHPLLTEALHSLLLCHCLVQTSPKELLRHTYMVARLVRQADGFPIFQASRSQARADWIEVLRRAEAQLPLSAFWETLCAPPPLPFYYDTHLTKPKTKVSDEQRRQDQAFLDAFDGERIEKERRAEQDRLPIATNISSVYGAGIATHPSLKRWSVEDGKDYPIVTERAASVSQWLREAPVVTGTTRRKKRTKKPSKAEGLDDSVEKLRLQDVPEDAAEP